MTVPKIQISIVSNIKIGHIILKIVLFPLTVGKSIKQIEVT